MSWSVSTRTGQQNMRSDVINLAGYVGPFNYLRASPELPQQYSNNRCWMLDVGRAW
ncbi:MAG: hypothetical protein ACJ0HV_01010 [Candidatus Pseudothioglobus sp.]